MLPSSMLADRFTGNMMVLSSIPAPQIRAFVFGTAGQGWNLDISRDAWNLRDAKP